jgi:hypothetical protein
MKTTIPGRVESLSMLTGSDNEVEVVVYSLEGSQTVRVHVPAPQAAGIRLGQHALVTVETVEAES